MTFARDWICRGGARDGLLIVASSRGAADDLLRGGLAPGTGAFGVHRVTPSQLVADLATAGLAAGELAPVTGLGARALAARAVADALAGDKLSYFTPVAQYPGFALALTATLRELREFQVKAPELERAGAPTTDLARLKGAYDEALQQYRLVDEPMLWELATEAAREQQHPFVGLPLLLLDLSPRNELQAALLSELVLRSARALATLVAGDETARLLSMRVFGAEVHDLDPEPDAKREASRLERLQRWVFLDPDPGESGQPGDRGPAPVAEADNSVVFVSAPGEGRECVEIARRMQTLAVEGIPFDRMAVLVRDPNAYLALLEEALAHACIPAFFTRGTVRPHPSGRAFLALLGCRAEGLSATRFAEYLSLGQVPMVDDAGAPPVVEVPWVKPEGAQLVFKSAVVQQPVPAPDDGQGPVVEGTLRVPRRWERLLVDAAVVGGRERWKTRLAGLQAELQLQVRVLEDEDPGHRRQLQCRLAGLGNLERFALPVIALLDELPERARWGAWLEQLRELAVRTLRSPAKVLGVLAELDPMSEVGPVGLSEVRRVLEERLAFLRTEPQGKRYGKVLVASIEEAAGRSFDTVFLPGLAEGLFPRHAAEDPLLLDEHRAELETAMPDRQHRVECERLLLRIAVGAAERQVVVSYPTVDTLQGRARVPSFYALDVLRASEGRLPDLEVLRRHAAAGTDSLLGWPAPNDPLLAIDEAEFDVAYLEPLLMKPRDDIRGRARFLLQTNEHLERSLRVRWQRWHPKLSPADGIVDPDPATLQVLQTQRLVNRTYSPTALQSYAACPYRFLLYAIHRLRPRQEAVALQQMDPLTRGSLFHEVQYRLHVTLRKKGLLPVSMDNREQVAALADEVLAQEASRYEEELAPAIPRVWRDEIESIGTDLRGWIHDVAERRDPWVPTFFEFSFGLGQEPGRDPLSRREEAVVVNGYRLRGSIDLVEYNAARQVWRVTDHKTGRAPRERFLVTRHGEVLQPLLYALAAEHHLGGAVETGRLYYCTRRGEYQTREVSLNAENRAKAAQVLETIDGAIAMGLLPAAPREHACEWCDYRSVCGPYEQTRWRRKNKARLEPLITIRSVS